MKDIGKRGNLKAEVDKSSRTVTCMKGRFVPISGKGQGVSFSQTAMLSKENGKMINEQEMALWNIKEGKSTKGSGKTMKKMVKVL